MNRKLPLSPLRTWALVLVILFQGGVLAMVYLNARIPAWTGEAVRLKTVPVDPRSLFRGNYALLRYDISRIPAADVNRDGKPRPNQRVYVTLIPQADGIYGYGGVSFNPPSNLPPGARYIRGRIKKPGHTRSGTYGITYGIEAWFAPKQKALALEKKLRTGATAEVWITDAGKAALKGVIAP